MAVKVGVDIVSVQRVVRLVADHAQAAERIFTAGELDYCRSKEHRYEHLAARFAAKEAVHKALGRGIGSGLRWQAVEVVTTQSGRPEVRLRGELADAARAEGVIDIDVSLSHTAEVAVAYAAVSYG